MAVIKSVEEKYMKEALKQAKKAYALGEVPIGCVIVHEGKIIGRGYNRRNTDKNTLAHAEITAINKASKVIGDWRLEECTLYVTLEPCQMCAGAIVQARIPEVVMGCMNPKAGCAGSILNILEMPQFNHQVKVTRGILEVECSQMLKTFFEELRIRNKQEKEARKSLSSLSGTYRIINTQYGNTYLLLASHKILNRNPPNTAIQGSHSDIGTSFFFHHKIPSMTNAISPAKYRILW